MVFGVANAKQFASKMDAVMSKVEFDTNGGCWFWSGAPNTYGYGQLWWGGQQPLAHRVAYESVHGAIPKGLSVLHRCDRPACCNPAHLFLGTPKDNTRDMLRKGRHWVPRGERSPHAKLSDEQALSAIRRCAAGENRASVALDFGVTRQCIDEIVNGRNFKHLRSVH